MVIKNGVRRGKLLPKSDHTVNRNVLSKEVADQLRARIREQRLAPESNLGTEAELAEEFGVSRTVIREAVGQLRGLGMVTSRQGRGLCVASVDMIDTLSKTLVPMLGDQSNWPELCHLRFVLEVGSLPLAVERATDDQIKRMHRLAKEMLKMVQKPDRGPKALERFVAQREIDFHQLIFNAAGSALAGRFHSILVEYFFESYGPGMHGTPPTLKDMQDHVKLSQAIEERDIGSAYVILIDHIRNILS
jgi:GntR family transcriptional regulator, transcriptional repressor for pyruvate dehydrogenase complex